MIMHDITWGVAPGYYKPGLWPDQKGNLLSLMHMRLAAALQKKSPLIDLTLPQ